MTFEQAKARSDYKFNTDGIENVISEIRNNYMDSLLEYGDPIRGAAVLEIGHVDVEVNIFTHEQCGIIDKGKIPKIDYFTCLKHGDTDDSWESDDYLDCDVNVDWNTDNWKEQLERDMFRALDAYVQSNGYSYDRPN